MRELRREVPVTVKYGAGIVPPVSYTITWEPPRSRGMRFSRYETSQILIAVAAMTLAFTIAQLGGMYSIGFYLEVGGPEFLALIAFASFVAVITAFLFHELAHKAVAQRYGCFAEFRMYPMGLLLGIVTAALGFLFAAPGAVMISGPVSPRQNVRISAAGPGTNLVIATAFVGIAVALGTVRSDLTDLARILIGTIAFVNLFLGGFNLIPFPPLDGSKIFAFDKVTWVAMVVALVAIGAGAWYLGVIHF